MGCIRWSEAQEKDLKPGLILYRKFGIHLYTAMLAENTTFTARVIQVDEEKEVEEHYCNGSKLNKSAAITAFPVLEEAGYKYSEGVDKVPE